MLTEHEILRGWTRLFKGGAVTEDIISKAEALIEELRYESPLRHRLSTELEELREKVNASISS